MYYIISSIRPDWPWSLSPGGLASNGYNGHTFWDCETWMCVVFSRLGFCPLLSCLRFPALLHFWPPLAQSALQYRFNHIAGARVKAQSDNPPYAGVRAMTKR